MLTWVCSVVGQFEGAWQFSDAGMDALHFVVECFVSVLLRTARDVSCKLFAGPCDLPADCIRFVLLARGEPGAPQLAAKRDARPASDAADAKSGAAAPAAASTADAKTYQPTQLPTEPTAFAIEEPHAKLRQDERNNSSSSIAPRKRWLVPSTATADSEDNRGGETVPTLCPLFFAHRDYFGLLASQSRADFDEAGGLRDADTRLPHLDLEYNYTLSDQEGSALQCSHTTPATAHQLDLKSPATRLYCACRSRKKWAGEGSEAVLRAADAAAQVREDALVHRALDGLTRTGLGRPALAEINLFKRGVEAFNERLRIRPQQFARLVREIVKGTRSACGCNREL